MAACKIDDCDGIHCRICGQHTDQFDIPCEDCQVARAMQEQEAITAAYGGNYEKALLDRGL